MNCSVYNLSRQELFRVGSHNFRFHFLRFAMRVTGNQIKCLKLKGKGCEVSHLRGKQFAVINISKRL